MNGFGYVRHTVRGKAWKAVITVFNAMSARKQSPATHSYRAEVSLLHMVVHFTSLHIFKA
jgi:hypothetical protein